MQLPCVVILPHEFPPYAILIYFIFETSNTISLMGQSSLHTEASLYQVSAH
jgi:hypothetical protein